MSYRDLIDIQRDASADGDPLPDHVGYEPLYRGVPCQIITTQGDETFRGRQLEAMTSHVIECRYLPSITPAMRCKVRGGLLDGRLLNITAVKPIDQINGQAAKLWLYCSEQVTV